MPEIDTVSKADFNRLEAKVDQLHKDYTALIVMQERQTDQGKRIGELEQRMKADEEVTKLVDKKVDSWVNRGIGVWLVVVVLFAIANAPLLSKLFGGK